MCSMCRPTLCKTTKSQEARFVMYNCNWHCRKYGWSVDKCRHPVASFCRQKFLLLSSLFRRGTISGTPWALYLHYAIPTADAVYQCIRWCTKKRSCLIYKQATRVHCAFSISRWFVGRFIWFKLHVGVIHRYAPAFSTATYSCSMLRTCFVWLPL